MYYELFNKVFEDNENKICIFEIGAFYVVLNEQAVYISSVLGLKKVCFAPGICKVGFPLNSLSKYVKRLEELGISFVVLSACNMDASADYTYKLKGFKKKYEYVDKMFKFCKSDYVCNCNKCSFKKTELMKELDNLRRMLASLDSKISNLELINNDSVKYETEVNRNIEEYEELMIWGKDE